MTLIGEATSIGKAGFQEINGYRAVKGETQAVNVPGPGKYTITGDFEKAMEKPQFHMGNKT